MGKGWRGKLREIETQKLDENEEARQMKREIERKRKGLKRVEGKRNKNQDEV